MSVRVTIVLLVALVLVAPAAASERRPTLPELEHEVMCPTCKTLLELSQAPVAERMRVFIRGRIAAGDSKSEIKARLVAEFGEAVLAAPRTRGFGLLAWVLPFVALLGAGVAIRSCRPEVDARRPSRSCPGGDVEEPPCPGRSGARAAARRGAGPLRRLMRTSLPAR
jgi:cytochrome c-type biogenesis protein CcmH